MQDELEDMMEMNNEIQEVMGRSYGMPEVDDDELEAELDALDDELGLDEDTSYLDDAVTAPSAPTSEPGMESATVIMIMIMIMIIVILIIIIVIIILIIILIIVMIIIIMMIVVIIILIIMIALEKKPGSTLQ